MSQPLIFSCDIPSTGSIVQEQVKQSAWQLRAMTNNVCYRYHDGEPRNLPVRRSIVVTACWDRRIQLL
jgi:hypothetical protein